MTIFMDIYSSDLGPIYMRANDDFLLSLDFEIPPFPETTQPNPILIRAKSQLDEYFSGIRKNFDIPVKIEGTHFQKKVLCAMGTIPYGEVISYSSLSEKIGHPRAFRAVGSACGSNRLPIIIPCHRVVAENGLGGFGCGIEKKKFLLRLEGSLDEPSF